MARKSTKKIIESEEQQIGQDSVRSFDKNDEITKPNIELVHSGKPQSWLDEMAFMNEEVIVLVHESTDKNSNPFPEVWVNGRVQRFVRGNEQRVRRCFVERLARAKLTTFGNVKTKNVDGEDTYVYPSHTGSAYPFAVIGDSEKGKAWLKKVLAEA
jgi:hypothetical protein